MRSFPQNIESFLFFEALKFGSCCILIIFLVGIGPRAVDVGGGFGSGEQGFVVDLVFIEAGGESGGLGEETGVVHAFSGGGGFGKLK